MVLGASPVLSIPFGGRKLSPSLLCSSGHMQGWLSCCALASKLLQGLGNVGLQLNFSHRPHSRGGGNQLPLTWLELKQSKPPPGPAEAIPFPPIPTINFPSGISQPRRDGITAPYFMIIHFCLRYLSLSCPQQHFQLGIPQKPQESWTILS